MSRRAGAALGSLLAALATLPALPACSAGGPGRPPPATAAASLPASPEPAPTPVDTTDAGPLAFAPCAAVADLASAGVAPARSRLLDLRCAVLQVPRDHARPAAGTLRIAVARVRSGRQHDRIGSLVLNPGGPGASGVDLLPGWLAWFPDELLERFDIVTFDPRGTGGSGPVACTGSPEQDGQPLGDVLDGQAFRAQQAAAGERANACARAVAATRAGFGTDSVARDLDLLRQGLGEARLSYVGWSYGARLGAHYAHLFPDRVRALVLDSPPHPTAPWPAVVAAQTHAFEATLDAYDRGCAGRDTCTLLNGSPRAVLDRLLRTAREQPIRSGRPAGDPAATWDTVLRAVLSLLPAPEQWPALDRALAEADGGDSGSLYDLIDAVEGRTAAHPDRDSTDIQQIVLCTDTPAADAAGLRRAATDLVRLSPGLGAYTAWWLFLCTPWTAPRATLPAPTTTTDAPLLTIAGTADPATPADGARALADILGPRATLLVSTRPGHTSFGRSRCVDGHVVHLLVALAAPPPGTTCG